MISFVVIGITDHPEPFFPPEVLKTIQDGKVFSGGRRHHGIVAQLLPKTAEWIDITMPLSAVFENYKATLSCRGGQGGAPIIVFASGDPLFFGFANTLRREFPHAEIRLFPTFNSLQMLAHRLLMPYHDLRIVSLTGRPWPAFDRALIERVPKIGVLTDREHPPAAIARRMLDYGYTCYNMHVGEHLGNPQHEKLTTLALEEAAQRDFEYPNCLIIEAPASSLETAGGVAPFGIPDSSFALLDGREKMITKMPVRLLTLQALDLPHRRVLWDIGACTGSVSIEARLRFPHLHVTAFEVRPACEAIIRENARRFGVPGIELHIGDFRLVCCDIIATSPPPDAVFIGGHGGHLKEIMAKVLTILDKDGVIVMNSVTSPVVSSMTNHRPDSRQLWDEACQELGLRQEPPLRIQLNDYNPIEILKCRRR
jgi:precorrin-6Y C5,15-methyltransferase (decarboxylating)